MHHLPTQFAYKLTHSGVSRACSLHDLMRWRGKGAGRYGWIARSSISNTPYAPGCGAWDIGSRGSGCTHGVRAHGSSIAHRRQPATRDGECAGGLALLRVPDASFSPFFAPRFSTQTIFIFAKSDKCGLRSFMDLRPTILTKMRFTNLRRTARDDNAAGHRGFNAATGPPATERYSAINATQTHASDTARLCPRLWSVRIERAHLRALWHWRSGAV